MNNAPLLASLGGSAKAAPVGGLESDAGEALVTDDRALDAALEFAALLLETGAAADGGKLLPATDGKLLPMPIDPIASAQPDVVLAGIAADGDTGEPIAAAVLIPETLATSTTRITEAAVTANGETAELGRQIANQIRRAQQAGVAINGAAIGNANADDPAQVVAAQPAALTQSAPAGLNPAAGLLAAGNNLKQNFDKEVLLLGPLRDLAAAGGQDQGSPAAASRAAPVLAGSIQESAALTPRSLSLDLPVGDQDWGRQFSERVGWVIHARVPNAQLRLNPEHLGPIEMSIEVDDNNARVNFVAAHALTREAIEQNLPRLREMLEQQGLNLQQADVGSGDSNRSADADTTRDDDAPSGVAASHNGDDADNAAEPKQRVIQTVGLIDTFV